MRLASLLCFPLLAACAPTAAEVERRELARRVDTLTAQLQRQESRLNELADGLTLVRTVAGESQRQRQEQSQAVERLQVVRLAPAQDAPPPDVEPVEADDEPPILLELSGDGPERLRVVPVPPPPTRTSAPPPTAARASAGKPDPEAEAAFNAALTDYREGRVGAAFAAFGAFLRRNAEHPLADNARYWMGECQFETKSYLGAIDEFVRVTRDFPQSKKVPEALLKIGLSYERLGDPRRARASFESLVKQYPRSAVAELARLRLQGSP